MVITTKKRMSDGTVFRIYDDLPYMGHYYTIEYLQVFNDHFHAWYPIEDTPKRIPTLEQAYAMLNELTED